MDLDPNDLAPEERYKLLTGCVVPRPIAVVSTVSPQGIPNLAPFSYFNVVGHLPMALSFCVAGRKPDRSPKDSLRNACSAAEGGTGEFVVNMAVESFAAAMAKTATPIAYEESEYDLAHLTPVPSKVVLPPRIGESPVAFECRTLQVVPVGISHLVIGEVVHMVIQDDLLDERFRVNPNELKAIGRMAGSQYCRTQDRFEIRDETFFPKRRES
ncbi:MAG TPA: flavin reductase family protein [Coleofasciculaceae cyanobacterium]